MEKAEILEALDGAALMIVAAGSDGKVEYVSHGARLMFGDIQGLDLSSPPPCDDPRSPTAALLGVWDGCREGGRCVDPKIVRAKVKGVPIYLWLQVLSLGEEGSRGFLFLFTDLTAMISGSEPVRALVSQLAHDLRSPLTSISGAAELLLSGRVGELAGAQQRLVKIVDDGTQKLAAIIKNVYEEGRERGAAE